jgi:hypothetical protein
MEYFVDLDTLESEVQIHKVRTTRILYSMDE